MAHFLSRYFGQTKWLIITILLGLALSLPQPGCIARSLDWQAVFEDKWTAPARTLVFPTAVNLGTVSIQSDWHTKSKPVAVHRLPARGKIMVPKDQFVTFEASGEFFKHPQLLSNLPANAFDSVELQLMSMDDSEDTLCDKAMATMDHFKGLSVLILDKSEVSDQGLKMIAGLTNLRYLSAFLTPLRGTFLKDITTLKQLRALALPSTGLKEEELKYLSALPLLQDLILNHTNLSDVGMKYISGCTKLTRLDVAKNPGITDKSIQYIRPLKALRTLAVADTSITTGSLVKLKGLDLTLLALSGDKRTRSQEASLKAAFPRAIIVFRGPPQKVDEDTGAIYSPLSKHRGL